MLFDLFSVCFSLALHPPKLCFLSVATQPLEALKLSSPWLSEIMTYLHLETCLFIMYTLEKH